MPTENIFIKHVRKRDGRIVPFDINRISSAIYRAMESVGDEGGPYQNDSYRNAEFVVGDLKKLASRYTASHPNDGEYIPGIEDIQHLVERNLMRGEFFDAGKHFILYRDERSKIRQRTNSVSPEVKDKVDESKKYLPNRLGEFVHFRTYSRWNDDLERRETWVETVDRFNNFMRENLEGRLSNEEYAEINYHIVNQKTMPSMRLMWGAGDAVRSSNVIAYNCSYTAPTELSDFGEMMYLLMCGTGVGFSAENHVVQQLPIIGRQNGDPSKMHLVEDSKEGWARALNDCLETTYSGYDINFDYSKVRPAGARLKTMGGRSSGPEALRVLLDYTKNKIKNNQGKRLSSLDVHDIVCKTGEIVVVGGVRRSALISLSDLEDNSMRHSKDGNFYALHPERAMANNSAVYNEKPTSTEFMKEWLALAESGSGERGIFNRSGLESQLPERRWNVFKDFYNDSGTNPCGEIYLASKQFCNLTEVVARPEDTESTLMNKIRIATILGTYQSSLTNFPFLSKDWKENCERERLLGVSITGIMDSPVAQNPKVLRKLKAHAIEVNNLYAERFGINPSTCVTCIKPSGTVSQLVNSSSGNHARHAPYYIRRVRISANDPLFHMMKDQKYPYDPEVGQSASTATTFVLGFPVKSPEGSVFRRDLGAIDQLENWKRVKENFTEHNPSVTVSVGEDEWIKAANWLHGNWNSLGGLSFLPMDDHVYQLPPYEEITEDRYNEMMANLPEIDFSHIISYEKDDQTAGSREFACVGGSCDL